GGAQYSVRTSLGKYRFLVLQAFRGDGASFDSVPGRAVQPFQPSEFRRAQRDPDQPQLRANPQRGLAARGAVRAQVPILSRLPRAAPQGSATDGELAHSPPGA